MVVILKRIKEIQNTFLGDNYKQGKCFLSSIIQIASSAIELYIKKKYIHTDKQEMKLD